MAAVYPNVRELAYLNERLLSAEINYEKVVADAIENCPSNLDAADFVYALTIGILSAILDTNDKTAELLNEIHQVASGEKTTDNPFIEALGKLLHHSGDWMDKVPTNKTNKNGKPVLSYVSRATPKAEGAGNVWVTENAPSATGPHRIFWGHDIFSCHEDNPFAILIRQYGVGRGVIQALRHLTADTCSRQGLPLPFSSYFDYIICEEDGKQKVENRLLDFCQQYSKEVFARKQGGFNNEVFNHMFSLRMQDILASGFVAAGLAVYAKGRKIEDKIRLCQLRVIGYMGAAYGSAVIGAAAHGGIPYINWPAFAALAKNVAQMIRTSKEEIETVILETERLVQEGNILALSERSLRNEAAADLLNALNKSGLDSGRNALINYFEEG